MLTDAFMDAAKEQDVEVVRFDAARMKVDTCFGCETCFKNGMPCSFDDDFNGFAREIQTADGLLFAFPLYWYTMPAKFKAVFDKLYCFYTTGRCRGLEWGLICCCGWPEASIMDGMKITMNRSANAMNWHFVGEVIVPNVNNPGDVAGTPAIEQARALVKAFIN